MSDENRRTRKQVAEETLIQMGIANEYLREIAQHLTMLRHLTAESCAELSRLRSLIERGEPDYSEVGERKTVVSEPAGS